MNGPPLPPTPDYRSKNQDVVQHILDILSDNAVTDALHFFDNPFREIDESELPCIKAAIMGGDSTMENTKIEYSHKPQIVVAYVCQGNDKLAAKLNYMGERISRFLINYENTENEKLGLDEMMQTGWDLSLEKGASGTGAIVLKFAGKYWTDHAPVLGPLEEVYVEYKPTTAPPDDDPLYDETITLPQS